MRAAIRADVGRAIAMTTGGALAFAAVEYVLTLVTYAGSTTLASKLRLAALTATLSLVLWLIVVALLAVAMVTFRGVRAQLDPSAREAPGWFVLSPRVRGVRPGVPRVWAALATSLVVGALVQRVAATAIINFKEPQLTAGVIAVAALASIPLAFLVHRAALLATTGAADALAPILRGANPFGRWRAAAVALVGLLAIALLVVYLVLPQSRSVMPTRMIASAVAFGLGMGLGLRRHLTPRPRVRDRRHALAVAGSGLVLVTLTFAWWGAELETKYVAVTASPALEKLITVVRYANDLDRDGYGTVLGEADCAPFDKSINRGATDLPDDGIDQNCDGIDFSLREMQTQTGPTLAVPTAFQKPWNVLLITIDTVRYDRTTFGGYAASDKHRDTTPRLQQLVNRATSFTFANAPSAGTMASIPAIMTSKFFHSGIALGDSPPGVPPKILPENTTLPEIMKMGGYFTGVIGSHEWWNDWGLDQGVDDYDNSIGKKPDPYIVAADRVTDHALAFVSRNQTKKWFLWAHYIDPHGRYVAHPNVVDYGATEPDLYDSEIKWTDQEIGRLLDELKRLPSTDNTLIVITSDHGDSQAEHGIPLGTHGTALYRELLHVPMIFYIPNNPPHIVGGAVTPLDIVPTLVQLCGIDIGKLTFEGKSLVPQLFTGTPDKARIVFSETNAPNKQRAAISEGWKLIYRLSSNVEELYDLAHDPWEHTNLAPKHPPELGVMKQALQRWMDRVLYARDPLFNQAFRQMKDVLATEPPSVPTTKQTLAAGAIEITGIGLPPGAVYRPGAKIEVLVYFKALEPTAKNLRFQVLVWPATPEPGTLPPAAPRSTLRATAEGAYATDKWKVGEQVRDRFEITLPADWTASQLVVGLIAADSQGGVKAAVTGATPKNDANVAILGILPVTVPSPAGSPPPPPP